VGREVTGQFLQPGSLLCQKETITLQGELPPWVRGAKNWAQNLSCQSSQGSTELSEGSKTPLILRPRRATDVVQEGAKGGPLHPWWGAGAGAEQGRVSPPASMQKSPDPHSLVVCVHDCRASAGLTFEGPDAATPCLPRRALLMSPWCILAFQTGDLGLPSGATGEEVPPSPELTTDSDKAPMHPATLSCAETLVSCHAIRINSWNEGTEEDQPFGGPKAPVVPYLLIHPAGVSPLP
jgi:hypothetical protein